MPFMDDALLLARRRELRKNATDAEQRLWRHLRGRRFRAVKFRRQHPIGPYVLDFYCASRALAVEIDGGQHFMSERREYDYKRMIYLTSKGIRLLRFSNSQLFNELTSVIEAIDLALAS
jgi:very-short-patch-repair endonuclease